jgi:NADP-dependent 3-hydroxy acid dehydrogenase YdfG
MGCNGSVISPDELAEVALTMAALPPHVEVLEATVIPHLQPFVGRG